MSDDLVDDLNTDPAPAADPAPAPEPKADDPAPKPADPAPAPKADDPAPEPKKDEPKSYWPDDWREKAAEFAAAGNPEIAAKRLNQLKRYVDPAALAAKTFELEAKFSEGGLTKVPGKDATDEEKEAFRKAVGYPETPEEFITNLKLSNNTVLGDMDKPVAERFATAFHKGNSPQEQFNLMVDEYNTMQEEQLAALDEQDDKHKSDFESQLKEEYGPATKRIKNAIESMFATAPGGLDENNPDSLYNRLFKGGRTADGRLILNDPDTFKWLASIAQEVKPLSVVAEDGIESGKSVDAEIKEIESLMRTDRRAYDKDPAIQKRYVELLTARERHQARNAA